MSQPKSFVNTKIFTPALIILAGINNQASAAIGDDEFLSEGDFLGDIPMITSASHFPQKRSDAPVAVSIISQQMIRASGALNVPDLFRMLPGFQSYIVDMGRPAISYRTIPDEYPNRMEIKIDGRSIYEPLISTVLWESFGIALEDIDYIEVVRGANAPADGSNSFNGSVNIISKAPLTTTGSSIRMLVGDGETRHLSATHSNRANEFSYRVKAEYKYNEGFPDDVEVVTQDDGNEIYNLDYYGSWTPTLHDSVEIHLGIDDSTLATSTRFNEYRAVPWEILSHYQYINWRRQLNAEQQLQLLFYHNHMNIDVMYDIGVASEIYGIDPGFIIPGLQDFMLRYEVQSRSDRYDIELRHSIEYMENSTLSWGGAVRYDRIDSPIYFNGRSAFSTQSERVFANLQQSINEYLLFNLGAISEHREGYGNTQSFRYSINIKPSQQHSFRISYNDAKRAPSILEEQMYYAVYEQGFLLDLLDTSAENLDEEALESFEIGYIGSYFDQRLTLDINLFDEKNNGLLSGRNIDVAGLDIDQEFRLRDNLTFAENRGIELQATFRPNYKWLISGQYTYVNIDAKKLAPDSPQQFNRDNKPFPNHTANLLISYTTTNNYELSANFYRQSEVDWSGGDVIDQYERLDLRIGRIFQLQGSKTLDVSLLAQNVLGKEYQEFHDFNRFDQRLFLKANFNF